MQTVTKTFNLFSIDELSEQAKQEAYNEYLRTLYYSWTDEYKYTLKEFSKLWGVSVDYRIDTYSGYSFDFDFISNDSIQEVKGLRLCKYLANNNVYFYKFNNKYVSARYMCENCGLTGYFVDYDIFKPIADASEYKAIYEDFEALLNACLDSFFTEWLEDMQREESNEYFEEQAREFGYLFDVDGNRMIEFES